MLFDFGAEAVDMQNEVIFATGIEEILNQLTEECGELTQAAQKVRRAIVGTTPISREQATEMLQEEAADVLLLIDYLDTAGMIDRERIVDTMREKNKRWYARIIGK